MLECSVPKVSPINNMGSLCKSIFMKGYAKRSYFLTSSNRPDLQINYQKSPVNLYAQAFCSNYKNPNANTSTLRKIYLNFRIILVLKFKKMNHNNLSSYNCTNNHIHHNNKKDMIISHPASSL